MTNEVSKLFAQADANDTHALLNNSLSKKQRTQLRKVAADMRRYALSLLPPLTEQERNMSDDDLLAELACMSA